MSTKPLRKIAILTSGGDAPGMNTVIRATVKVAARAGIHVVGVMHGYDGLIDGRFRGLTREDPHNPDSLNTPEDIEQIVGWGGTILGSARAPRFLDASMRARAAGNLRGMDGLIVVGGNGSLAGAYALAKENDVAVVGVPASIDNDIGASSMAIGVDTALNTIVEACDRISNTARSHRRAFIVEVMGRESGYLAMASAIAAGADAVLFRERGREQQEILDDLENVVRQAFSAPRDKQRVLVVKSEGVRIPCTQLVDELQRRLRTDAPEVGVRGVVLGHTVRGGTPSHFDRMMAGRMALGAVEALSSGATSEMIGWEPWDGLGKSTDDPSLRSVPLSQVQKASRALLDGTSTLTQWRIRMLERIGGVSGV